MRITSRNGARDGESNIIVGQIGRGNLMAISGCQVIHQEHGIRLPVGSGYSVVVTYEDDDTYTVERIFKRGAKVFPKGERKDVHAEELGDVAYYASCFRSHKEF